QAMTAGNIYTVAGGGSAGLGDGGPATGAQLAGPWNAAVDAQGNLVIADTGDNLVRVVAGTTGTFYGQAMTAGDIYSIAGNGAQGFAGDGGPATGAELALPAAVVTDAGGDVLISDTGNNRLREVAGCPSAGSHEIISIPGSGPNPRAVDWNWRVTRENPGPPVVRGVPPPAGDARRAQGRPRPAGQGFFATPPTRPGV